MTDAITNEGLGELGKLVSGELATAVKSVVCIKTACTADAAQTAAGITKCTEAGLTLADADSVSSVTTTQTDDTVRLTHEFTAGASATVKGFGVLNDDDDVLYAISCFAADVALLSGDKLSVQMDIQFSAS
jgi:hypothetical protein